MRARFFFTGGRVVLFGEILLSFFSGRRSFMLEQRRRRHTIDSIQVTEAREREEVLEAAPDLKHRGKHKDLKGLLPAHRLPSQD
ncbi:hypothetical protein VNO77_02100 [Canavalia gladiata]|uniref:Uncharacterized protein n=1 Tax=Canavalia gladiata TaxID=3824 RepID=A0AAN9RAZ0_CANGL